MTVERRDGHAKPAIGLQEYDSILDSADYLCRHLQEEGIELCSLYLIRAGQLRCYASRGYRQVMDGMDESRGIMGRTVEKGRTQVVDPRHEPDYIPVAEGTVQEICVPIWVDGEVVGALDLETMRPLSQSKIEEIEGFAEEFSAFLQGHTREDESGWQRLADAAPQLSQLRNVGEIARTALDLGLVIVGATTGAVVLPDHSGRAVVVDWTEGSHRQYLPTTATDIEEIFDWLKWCRTAYAMTSSEGTRPTSAASVVPPGLNRAFVIATRIDLADDGLGYLVFIRAEGTKPEPAVGQQLEVLATLAGGAITTTESIEALTLAATRDPLTGLLHRRVFRTRMDTPAGAGVSTAVLAIDVDNFKSINDQDGHAAGDQALVRLAAALQSALRESDGLFRTGGDEFAAVIELSDTGDPAVAADRVLQAARQVNIPISIGVARAVPGRPLSEAYHAADTALLGVKRSGRNGYAVVG